MVSESYVSGSESVYFAIISFVANVFEVKIFCICSKKMMTRYLHRSNACDSSIY